MFWEHIKLYTLLVIGISLVLANAIITNIWLDNKFLISDSSDPNDNDKDFTKFC
jgi:hypothetical protein